MCRRHWKPKELYKQVVPGTCPQKSSAQKFVKRFCCKLGTLVFGEEDHGVLGVQGPLESKYPESPECQRLF